jgi:hypothetical protein
MKLKDYFLFVVGVAMLFMMLSLISYGRQSKTSTQGWEYKVVYDQDLKGETSLSQLGEEGWELNSVVPKMEISNGYSSNSHNQYFFKRPK